MLLKDLIFCAYERFPNLKDIMVRADPCSIKPLKEIDQDPAWSYYMKRCDSCKSFLDDISSCVALCSPYMNVLLQKTKF